jgi:dolichyl-phosphate-mannose--protein O-mannosyl transferase
MNDNVKKGLEAAKQTVKKSTPYNMTLFRTLAASVAGILAGMNLIKESNVDELTTGLASLFFIVWQLYAHHKALKQTPPEA